MKKHFTIIIFILVVLDLVAWGSILFDEFGKQLELYFFDVGQGDSEMIVMPGNVKLLMDGGPDNSKAVQQLDAVVPWHDRYIDMVMISHAELDHFGGLLDVLERYEVGVFIYNGEGSDSESFKELARVIKEQKIPVVIMEEGDSISYSNNILKILSENSDANKGDKNESAIVAKFEGGGISTLFTGDIGKPTEQWLTQNKNIQADIIKIPHHGSKFSSTQEFLKAVRPKVAVIEVGKNSYGHPTKDVLDRIKNAGAQLFRTDTDGMVRLVIENGIIKQYKEREK
ncbi:MAG: ComEC [Candidatus Wolfebacteria bacterium GW2011_GWE2_44_13]|uniref:ComEC n=1 Tax=Candidatus Wolfebacteria bacterium GW2011_GWE2_44_13 TaxID=1619017 RepID=A0A0G1JGP2_9BACT|nr:MAG: ComEC [Candidatus Wolfebacteria bacterium GW2011_GWE2_44_13]